MILDSSNPSRSLEGLTKTADQIIEFLGTRIAAVYTTSSSQSEMTPMYDKLS